MVIQAQPPLIVPIEDLSEAHSMTETNQYVRDLIASYATTLPAPTTRFATSPTPTRRAKSSASEASERAHG